MAAGSFSKEAVVSISSHFSNILLQHFFGLVGLAASIIFNSSLDMPSSIPITFQSAAYTGVICLQREASDGVDPIAAKKIIR